MNKSILVKILGYPATLIHGDCLVLDRWLWLRSLLPRTANGEKLLDVGCGTGAFTIGAALRGYEATGITFQEDDTRRAAERANLCGARSASFRILDARNLDSASEFHDAFDVIVCCELIEHIIDDRKLFQDMTRCLKPGGRLLLTTPWYHYPPMSKWEDGPFPQTECGWHVRRGYTEVMLRELCDDSGLRVERVSTLNGFLSQKLTALLWRMEKLSRLGAWLTLLPFRVLPPLFDPLIRRLFGWPNYSISLQAQKPRFGQSTPAGPQPALVPDRSRRPA